jgi:nitrilase
LLRDSGRRSGRCGLPALESACFVVNATAWLNADQQSQLMKDTGCAIEPISGGCFTAIVNPHGQIIGEPLKAG